MNNFFRSCLFISLGLVLGGILCYFAPTSFKDSYQSMLLCQYDYYRGIKEPGKILVIGGSSVAFGIDLDTLEEKTGRPSAEFGVHLGMGYSFLMEASKCNLHSGDVVVIEFFNRSLDDFVPELILSGIGGRTDMYRYFLPRFWTKVACDYPRYIMKCYYYNKFKYNDNGYENLDFDKRGCMIKHRDDKNADDIEEYANRDTRLNDYDDIPQDFLDYLNEYVDYCRSLNVKVFFTYPPYFDENLDWHEEDGNCYDKILASKLHAPLVTNLKDAIYPREYIWGYPLHLNTEGAKIRSTRLAEALLPYLESADSSSADCPRKTY